MDLKIHRLKESCTRCLTNQTPYRHESHHPTEEDAVAGQGPVPFQDSPELAGTISQSEIDRLEADVNPVNLVALHMTESISKCLEDPIKNPPSDSECYEHRSERSLARYLCLPEDSE